MDMPKIVTLSNGMTMPKRMMLKKLTGEAVSRDFCNSPRHSLFCHLHQMCSYAFDAWEREADTIEQSIKALRALVLEMR